MINTYVQTYNKVFVMLLEQIQKLTAANGAALEVVGNSYTIYQAVCGELTPFLGVQIPLENTFSGACHLTQQPLACSDISNSKDDMARIAKMTFAQKNIHSMALIPVIHNNNVIAVIKLTSENPYYFTNHNVTEFEDWVNPLIKSIVAAMQDAAKIAEKTQKEIDTKHKNQLETLHRMISPNECNGRGFIALQALANVINEGVFLTDDTGQCVYANDKYLSVRDMNEKEVLKNGWTKRIDKNDLEILKETWQNAVQNQSNFISEYRCYSKDGIPKHVRVQAVPLKENGNFFGYLGILTEIAPII